MPLRPCKAPLCPALLPPGSRWCDAHKHLAPAVDRRAYHRHYDQHLRDADAKAFYNSLAWQQARERRIAAAPVCEECRRAWSTTVHHDKPLKECRTLAEKLDQKNLKAVCQPCHSVIEAARAIAARAAR